MLLNQYTTRHLTKMSQCISSSFSVGISERKECDKRYFEIEITGQFQGPRLLMCAAPTPSNFEILRIQAGPHFFKVPVNPQYVNQAMQTQLQSFHIPSKLP